MRYDADPDHGYEKYIHESARHHPFSQGHGFCSSPAREAHVLEIVSVDNASQTLEAGSMDKALHHAQEQACEDVRGILAARLKFCIVGNYFVCSSMMRECTGTVPCSFLGERNAPRQITNCLRHEDTAVHRRCFKRRYRFDQPVLRGKGKW